MYQRKGKSAFNNKLDNIKKFASYLNHPEKKFKSIHVAGTNGKGSSSHMLASILQEAGYTVGLYTSPHLKDYRERIKINGRVISKSAVVDFVLENKSFLEKNKLSFFEMSVGLAFNHFANQKVDIAIIEVGLGGRLDSTNIITPEVSLITNIGLDHVDILGKTLGEIASEKAGIIKENVPVVISERQEELVDVFISIAENKKAKKHLETLMNYLNVQEDNQVKIKEQLNGSFTQNYLNGYFETVDTDQGFWFIDYNRLINHQIPDLKGGKTKSDISGQCASVGTYAGNVSIIDDPTDAKFNDGDVLVCDMTSPKYLPLMQKAGAIITRRGGVTCHAAIVARELGVPCIIGIGNAIEILKNGQQVEIDANNGIVKIIESKKANKNEDYVFAFGAHKIAFNQMEAEMKYFVENKFSFFSINNGFLYFEGDVMDAYFSHKDTYINLPDFGTKYLDKKYFNGYLTSLNKAVVSSKDWYQEMWVCNKADLTPDLLIDRYQELYDHLGLLFGFLNSTGKEVLCGIEKQLRTLLEEKYHDNLEEVFALLTTPDVMDEIKEE